MLDTNDIGTAEPPNNRGARGAQGASGPSSGSFWRKSAERADPLDFITVASAAGGRLMTKVFRTPAQPRSYDKAILFDFSSPAITCLDDLAHILDGLDRHSCVIYGRLIEGTVMPCRRLLREDATTGEPATIEDAAHPWLLVDIDKLAIEGEVFDPIAEPERAVEYTLARLPSEFHGARCLWRLTSSAGVAPADTISMRLGFWLDRALTGAEAKAWLTNTIADCSIYTANQPIYAATPIFKDGRTDPVARRSGIVEGRPAVSPPNNIKTMKPHEPRGVSGGVMFDANDAIMAGRHLLQRTLAIDEWKHPRWCPPTPTGARAYKLAERLKDFALSEQQIVDLLIETIPSFDQEARPRIEAMVESAFLHGQNDPGCGSPNNAVFSEIIYGWEAKIEENKEFWDRIIEASQGAISRLPTPRVASRKFPREFTKKARQIIAEDRAEWAQAVKRGAK